MSWAWWYYLWSWLRARHNNDSFFVGQSFHCMWAKASSAKKQFKTRRHVFAQFYSRTTRSYRRQHYVSTAASLISDAVRTSGLALNLAEDRKIGHYYQKCSDMILHFIPVALESFGGLSEITQKTLKRIALLSINGGFQPSGLSVAFNRLTQALSITAMRGSATMLIARD